MGKLTTGKSTNEFNYLATHYGDIEKHGGGGTESVESKKKNEKEKMKIFWE